MSSDAPSDLTTAGAPGATSARKRHALELFSGLPQRYDLLSALLSFGQDPRWRRALVSAVEPEHCRQVLDVATGTGLVAAELLRQGAREVVAIDQSESMLEAARRRFSTGSGTASEAGRCDPRVRLIRGQAEALPFADASFDGLTFTYLLRYVDDPARTVAELARVLRPGARIASLEFGVPPRLVPRAAWRAYTRIGLPAAGRLVSSEWAAVGRFLGPSILDFYERHPLERIMGYWRAAGLDDVQMRRMSLGGGVLMFARRAPAQPRAAAAGEV